MGFFKKRKPFDHYAAARTELWAKAENSPGLARLLTEIDKGRERQDEQAEQERPIPKGYRARHGVFRQATVEEYVDWLHNHVEQGGKITHVYDYPFGNREWLVAQSGFTLGGECGVMARSIIVEPGVQYVGGGLGHNTLYFMDGFAIVGQASFVPVYDDAAFTSVPGYKRAMAEERDRKNMQMHKRRDQERRFAAMGEVSDLTRYLNRP